MKPPEEPWWATSSTLHVSALGFDPAGTRPWIPGSGLEPGPHVARGVAVTGGSGFCCTGAMTGVCPSPCPSAKRSLSGPAGICATADAGSASPASAMDTTMLLPTLCISFSSECSRSLRVAACHEAEPDAARAVPGKTKAPAAARASDGPYWARTSDLLLVEQALSQLS